MSGYLPPHSTDGPQSKIYRPKNYTLKPGDVSADSDEVREYRLSIPRDVTPTIKTVITIESEGQVVRFNPIGFGLWTFGDVLTYGWGPSGGYDQNLNDESIREAFKAFSQQETATLIDTAEHYGYTDGYSEKSVGRFWSEALDNKKADRTKIVFATKYFPTPWRHPWKYPSIVPRCVGGSLSRSHMGQIDIYQLHGPSHWGFWPRLETLCEGLAQAHSTGAVKTIGTCNLSFNQVKYVYAFMKKRKIPYVSNQVEFSLVRCDPWTTGLIEKCHKLGVSEHRTQCRSKLI
jgi:pyridoxine 4-dehydrogenase